MGRYERIDGMKEYMQLIVRELSNIAQAIRELVAELQDIRKDIDYWRSQGGGYLG